MDVDGAVHDRGTRAARTLPVLLTVLVALAGCQAAAAQTCVSWMSYPDDAARARTAHVVVDATVAGKVGERRMFGARATVWSVEVAAVHKGGVEPGERLAVASTPRTCSGGPYPDGDPLAATGQVRLYLRDTDFAVPDTEAGWALITPFDGVRPLG